AIPVARRVGGLADTIEDYAPQTRKGTGFLFEPADATSLLIALVRAWINWKHRRAWMRLQRNAMHKDFSWEHSAAEYVKMFREAAALKKEPHDA
ncbi:MAG: glycogen synthase GlgA, partial [Minisyncoccia bacterium]